ncbi:AMP-binding protein [Plebeiibacterium marinum]|uniref:AMP-binding protein n=1 Tax=Plebeiibacterium marinum TaxID=2992111 RepID=A0AAE3MD05_9BACT|nr:AMP-binding protein [Plebeiobacterium marinum]MCW3805274.1 AMP-binding protein [Plebeiobacterium marinum]
MENNGFIGMIQRALTTYKGKYAFSDYGGETYSYDQVAEKIYWFHQLFEKCGIEKGDKVALIGRNLSNYAVSYLATVTYGAVAVPVLPDFGSSEIHHIVSHSESKILLSTDLIFNKIDESKMSGIIGIVSIESFKPLASCSVNLDKIINSICIPENISAESLNFAQVDKDEMMVLSYTSGTSGFSKGVMLPHRSIWSNVLFAQENLKLYPGNRIVSFLPLAHAYGCLFEFLWPFTVGCHITFLSRTPSPKIITEAFQKVKPHLILSVPLILEKIFKKRIAPALEKPTVKTISKIPVLNQVVYQKIKKQLVDVFGGEFQQIVIGGAALSKDVEDFLRKIGFPFTIGYGMTECGPLISYAPFDSTKVRSAGRLVDRMEVKIDSPDPHNEVGEIMVKGTNIMLGYYKNQEATKEVFDKDGWLHTGDLGVIDKENFIFIKGRSKNMILSGSGQNIYPEEIEARLNNMEYVQECLVRDMGNGKLEALIYPDYEMADAEKLSESKLREKILELKKTINAELPAYMNLAEVTLFPEEFEKTPKKSIKRYKYTKL